MSAKEEASLLMFQSLLLMFPERGKVQLTPGEWILLCDRLLILEATKAKELGPLSAQLKMRRPKIKGMLPNENEPIEYLLHCA